MDLEYIEYFHDQYIVEWGKFLAVLFSVSVAVKD